MNKKRIILITILILSLAAAFYSLRGPNISNALKKLVLPELETATGRKFVARKIYINLFPFFVEIKGLQGFDNKGQRIIKAERVKGYIGLSGLIDREIVIRRLVIKDPEIVLARPALEEIMGNVERYLSKESELPFKVVVKSLEVGNADLSLTDGASRLLVQGLRAEGILSKEPRFRIVSRKVSLAPEKGPKVYGMVETLFTVKGKRVDLDRFRISSRKSTVKLSGFWDSQSGAGEFRTETVVFLESIKEFFGLKNKGEGSVRAQGKITLHDLSSGLLSGIQIDIRAKGDMYLEALMDILKVKERLEGRLSFEGKVKGPLNNLDGKAEVLLKKGNIYGVEVDRLSTQLSYRDGIMAFTKGNGELYGGKAQAEAAITLPVVTSFSLSVKGQGLSSKGLFRLIRWDPGIPEGEVTGELRSSGAKFAPAGTFSYAAKEEGKDILGRIRAVSGQFSMSEDVIQFPRLALSTGRSSAISAGTVDLAGKGLSLSLSGNTSDATDLSGPYFTAVSGGGEVQGRLEGKFDDPVVKLRFSAKELRLAPHRLSLPFTVKEQSLPVREIRGELTYRKNLLQVHEFRAHSAWGSVGIKGDIQFPRAKALFDIEAPSYGLSISADGMAVKELAESLSPDLSLSGDLRTAFTLSGEPQALKTDGDFQLLRLSLTEGQYTYPLADRMTGRFASEGKGIAISGLSLKRGNTLLSGQARLTRDGRLAIEAESKRVILQEFLPSPSPSFARLAVGVTLKDLRLSGQGSLDSPHLELQGGISGEHIGDGTIKAALTGKTFDLKASLFNDQCTVTGKALLAGDMPWSATVDMRAARYNSLVTHLLKDVPEDLLISLTGRITAQGNREHIDASAIIDKANVHLYGIGLINGSPLVLNLKDKDLSVRSFSMKSDTTEFRITGGVRLGERYDLDLSGSSSLSPLMAVSKTLDLVKGNANFVFSVSGPWEKPKINGGMDVSNGSLGIKGINYRLTSLSAFLYVDEDRVIIEKVSGNISGGSITLTGSAYLDGFSLKRFFLESHITGVTASVTKDLWANLDGELYLRGTPQAQTLLGDIHINKGLYSERIEWKSWLVSARPREKPRIEAEALRNMTMNVRVRGENLAVNNNVAQASLTVDFLLKGTPGSPVILGKAEATKGLVYFRNSDFSILKARADFSDPNFINPYFDIIAETRIINYDIRLALYGHMEQFNLAVSSDPPLPESDIFSLLTVGRVEKDLKGMKGGIGASEATSFLTGKLQDVMEERVKTITGFDRVQVDSYVSRTTGTVTPRLTVSKRLIGDKLYVTYSSGIGSAGGEEQVWKLEYMLWKNISLVGIRDERGGMGGDVKFKFEFK